MRILKALSAVLSYPTEELVAALPEINEVLAREARLPELVRVRLIALTGELLTSDLLDIQERYVGLFDRGRATALHLFEHVHGESRDRGQAMVDLKELYARAGFELTARELPDYLPAMLEFLSHRPYEEAQELLGDCAHTLRAIGERLQASGSRYAAVFAALLAFIGAEGLNPDARPQPQPEQSLDEEWAEAPAFAGAACTAGRTPAQSVIRLVKRTA